MPYINFEQLVKLEADCQGAPAMGWRSVGHSHIGKVRKVNEDAFYHSAEQSIWAIADGMGGLARGDYAAAAVVDAFVHFAPAKTLALSIRDLELRLREAHDRCRNSFPGEPVGAAVAALFAYCGFGFFLWAGDSRVYRFRDQQILQMTTDHSVAQEKVRRGELTETQARTHPSAHVLTRAVGVHQTLHLEIDYAQVKPGDRYLVCSDGLYNGLTDNEICQRLAQPSIEEVLKSLMDDALAKGGGDNITAIVIQAESLTNE